MSSFLRFSLLTMCAAAGIAAAVCVATTTPPGTSAAATTIGATSATEPESTSAARERSDRSDRLFAASSLAKRAHSAPTAGMDYELALNGPRGFEPHDAPYFAVAPSPPLRSFAPPLAADAAPQQIQPPITQQVVPKQPSLSDVLKSIPPEQLRELQRLTAAKPGDDNPFETTTEEAPPAPTPTPTQGSIKIRPSTPGGNPAGAPAGADKLDKRPTAPERVAAPAGKKPGTVAKSRPKITRAPGEGDDHLTVNIQDSDIREVLEMLSEQGGLNILPAGSVHGRVTASLKDVDVEGALEAILRTTGFVARRDGRFIYVGTPQDFQNIERSLDRIGTRVYRPNYIRAAELQALITPLLTQGVGAVSVSTPAEVGIPADGNKVGGDAFAGGEAVLVKDYEAVLVQVDQIASELDQKPLQVAIEAMVLSVKLSDENQFGVDFQLLRNKQNIRAGIGNPAADLAAVRFTDGGLKFGFLDSSLGAFLSALETIGKTDVVATPRLMCLNKHRAEILIGSQLGYISSTVTETSTSQSVQFLEVGTQLRIRPFISSDGSIRMEVHPELSTGTVEVRNGFTLPEKDVTQVTTNVMTRDGCTVIIGGLMRDDLSTTTTQVPLLGSLPGVGFLFRNKKENSERREILVLITPHIVCEPKTSAEGQKGASDFHRRHASYADHMSPIGFGYLSRKYFRSAEEAWQKGDAKTALRLVNLAIHFDPQSRAALELRATIAGGSDFSDLGSSKTTVQAIGSDGSLDGQEIAPWVLDDLEGVAPSQSPDNQYDPGRRGHSVNIHRPERLQ